MDFAEDVTLFTFGDDSIASVRNSARWFNMKSILDVWSQDGIPGTNGMKDANTLEYYSINEVEFLKRKFLYIPELKVCFCPLEIRSIIKSLTVHVPSKFMTDEAVLVQCIDNAVVEFTFHGESIFNHYVAILQKLARDYSLRPYLEFIDHDYVSMVEVINKRYHEDILVTSNLKQGSFQIARLVYSFFDPKQWLYSTRFTNKNNDTIDQNPPVLKRVVPDRTILNITKQSGLINKQEQNVNFVEPDIDNSLSMGNSAESRVSDNMDLGSFFSRPLKIGEIVWGSSTLTQVFSPWTSIMSNARVANRMSNYKLLKAKLHVKFVVNGNGFFYGKLMASYLPLALYDNFSDLSMTGQSRVQLSQMPHIFLDPTTSQGGEMILPFFWLADYVDITDAGTTAARALGNIYISQLAPLRHASSNIASTLDTVTISVFAWLENVELEALTMTNMAGITAQSGREKKRNSVSTSREAEHEGKPISQGATAIANVAKVLGKVPIISPYARAVEQAATMTSTVASALGYCRPNAVAEPSLYQPRAVGNLGLTNTTDSSMKLSVDVKQELTIDSTPLGLEGIDELSVARIAGTDSFLTSWDWATSQASETLLWNVRVDPIMYDYNATILYRTAVCGATIPFRYWTGSLIYRFDIVASAFHRGRLAITYDPNPGTGGGREDNLVFVEIVDIATTKSFEIEVSNHQHTAWIPVSQTLTTPGSFWSTGALTTASAGSNGTIAIYVLNELTTSNYDPTIDLGVKVLTFVRAGDDFQVSNPVGNQVRTIQPISQQSGIEGTDEVNREKNLHLNSPDDHITTDICRAPA